MDNNGASLIGMHMKRIRIDNKLTQQQVCDKWPRSNGSTVAAIDRTVYAKYESGKLTPSDERIEQFASIFDINPDELKRLYQSTAIVIPDTSALLNNSMLLEMLMEDFDQVVIASTVQLELSGMKNANGDLSNEKKINKKKASQIIGKINELFEQQDIQLEEDKKYKIRIRKEDSESDELSGDSRISINDRKLIALAQKLAKKTSRKVFILHYDKDIPFFSDDTISNIKLNDYMAKRYSTPAGYQTILDFDEEYDRIEQYEKLFDNLDKNSINTYLPMIGNGGVSLNEFHNFISKAQEKLNVRTGGYDCTMYGGMCGAGINNIFYANGNVYLCGNCVDLPVIANSAVLLDNIDPDLPLFDRKQCYREIQQL